MARAPALLYSSNRFLNASIQEEETSYFKASNGGKKEKIIRHLVSKAEAQVGRLASLPEHAHVRLLPSCVIFNGSPDSSVKICFVLTFDSAGETAGGPILLILERSRFLHSQVCLIICFALTFDSAGGPAGGAILLVWAGTAHNTH